jgi:hypothetical protein
MTTRMLVETACTVAPQRFAEFFPARVRTGGNGVTLPQTE